MPVSNLFKASSTGTLAVGIPNSDEPLPKPQITLEEQTIGKGVQGFSGITASGLIGNEELDQVNVCDRSFFPHVRVLTHIHAYSEK